MEKQAIILIPVDQSCKDFQSQIFSVPKKDRGIRPIINLKKLNTFVETVHFKMEGIYMLKDTMKQGDWMTKVKFEGHIFHDPNSKASETPAEVQMQSRTYYFNCLLWTVVCTLGRHHDHETCSDYPQINEPEANSIYRRHANKGRDTGSIRTY